MNICFIGATSTIRDVIIRDAIEKLDRVLMSIDTHLEEDQEQFTVVPNIEYGISKDEECKCQ